METWEELKKQREEIIRKEFADAGREGGINPAVAALPVSEFPGVNVGKVRVNTSAEMQPLGMPSMGQVPVGGGDITLSGGEAKPMDTSPAQMMGSSGDSQIRLPTSQDYALARKPLFLGRMADNGVASTTPRLETTPVSLEGRSPLTINFASLGNNPLRFGDTEKAISDYMNTRGVQSALKRQPGYKRIEEEERSGELFR